MKDGVKALISMIVLATIGIVLLIVGLPVAKFLFPILVYASLYVFLILLIVILPMSFSKRFKKATYYIFNYSSYVFGLTAWIWAYLICMYIWGIISVIIGLIIAGIGIVPIAVIASISQGDWVTVVQLSFLVILAVGCRGYAYKILERLMLESALSAENTEQN